jgi:hypothetical protein
MFKIETWQGMFKKETWQGMFKKETWYWKHKTMKSIASNRKCFTVFVCLSEMRGANYFEC